MALTNGASVTADELRDGQALRAARRQLGLSAQRFADLVGVEGGRTVRRWEAEDRDVPGPVRVLVALLMSCPPARRQLGLE